MIKIAVLGYGVVGSGLIELVDKNREISKIDAVITSILVRDIKKHNEKKHSEVLTTDIQELFSKESDVIIEVMGGLHPTYEYVKRALLEKKNVITANKDLIAEYGEELFKIAKDNNVQLKFEAAVAGGIPVIKALTESLAGNDVNEIRAILNGTTNFILTKMQNEEISYEDALLEAQRLGFAESNPEADVMGYDAARKLSILSTLAFNKKVFWKDQLIEGITNIDLLDFKYAEKVNCKVKLVASSINNEDGVFATIRPTLVPNDNVLSLINNEFNAVVLNGDSVGEVVLTGKGAGKLPTGSAVYADLLDIVKKRGLDIEAFNSEKIEINTVLRESCSAVLRIKTTNQEEVINSYNNLFDKVEVLQVENDEEVAFFISDKSEEIINSKINLIKENRFVKDIKKMIKL
ncbi:homoserine dehydrogenase [Clostridium sp.]|uniref:homoserine dehydrogenase n=1 Tax=Clostridium sp. TaxID=1506 RepID=UPI003F375E59